MNTLKTKSGGKPHILIYAHYYHPDVASTGQLLKELAEGLLEHFRITVVCAVPSYDGPIPPEYQTKKYYREDCNGVEVLRVSVPEFNKANKGSRIKNIVAYFFRAIHATGMAKDVDYVYSISQPPVLGGLLGVWGKWRKRAKFIYNIQDFNPEQTIATGYSKNQLVLKLLMFLDKFSCRRANQIIIVGRDMIETLKNRFKNKKVPPYTFINNWIDENQIYPLTKADSKVAAFCKENGLDNKFVFMYSGNLGLYYDLENLLRLVHELPKPLRTPDGREVAFVFIGAGSIKDKLVQYKEENHMDNVYFIPYQDKELLNYSLNAADVHWCVSAKGIRGVSVPSKLYGQIATGKPVFAVLEKGAEAQLIIEETNCGLVCEPCDYAQMKENLQWFIDHANDPVLDEMGARGREYLVQHLTKDISLQHYYETIINT